MTPFRYALLFAAAVVAMIVSAPAAHGQTTPPGDAAVLFEGARLIVGDGTAIDNSAFVVARGRFTSVGRRGQVQAPAGALRVDLTGKTVIPALVDGHSHIGYQKGVSTSVKNYSRENILDHMKRFAY